MTIDPFVNFNGNCRQAVEWYAKIFKTEVVGLMTFADAPANPAFPMAEADRSRVLYASLPLGGNNVMFSDVPAGRPITVGNNISLTVGSDNADELRRIFDELKTDGQVQMPLQKTFWSDLYGAVTDQFGVTWQLSYSGARQ